MERTARAFFLLVLAVLPALAAGQEAVRFERDRVTLVSGQRSFFFDVEMAVTPEQHAYGLTGRTALPAHAGMLFDLGKPRSVNMWMKGAVIPLDMLFVDAGGTVVNIAHDAVPRSETLIPSGGPVRAILELQAGTARRLGIAVGDRLVHPIFVPGKPG